LQKLCKQRNDVARYIRIMAVGIINIIGQIGHSYNPDGSIAVEGVTVADVVGQLASQPNCDSYEVWIDSPGGSVEIGNEFGAIVAKIPNCSTYAKNLCASIATVPFLAVPKAQRFIVEGCVFMVHNPLVQQVSGNASELKQIASFLEPLQEELLKVYVKATGAPKSALQSLMNVETSLTPEQAVTMGFASAIIKNKEYKAVAFTDKLTNKIDMGKSFLESLGIVKAAAKAQGVVIPEATTRNAVALVLETDKGSITTPFDDIMLGDVATLTETGEIAPDDTYTLPDGMVVVVSGGAGEITEVIPVASGELTAVVVALQEEVATLKATIAEQEIAMEAVATAMQAIEAKALRSNHVPAASAVSFRPVGGKPAPTAVTAQELLDRRAAKNQIKK
jgi:ATP-dependent Clp protease protease subunit